MLKLNTRQFSKNELAFIIPLKEYFTTYFNGDIHGSIEDSGSFVRYEFFVGDQIKNNALVLQFKVKDQENIDEGNCNYVHISNIVIPFDYRGQGIARAIVVLMSIVAHKQVGIELFITGIVNDRWKDNLLCLGGIEDDSGDIQIDHDVIDYKMRHGQLDW